MSRASQPEREGFSRATIRLLPLGAALAATMAMLAWVDARTHTAAWLALAAIAAALFLTACWIASRPAPASTGALAAVLILAALCRMPLALAAPTLSDDIYRYIWDGRVQRAGLSPYEAAPADPALASLHTATTRLTNHPDLPTIYPPAAQWFFRGVASVGDSVLAFKLAFLACDALIVVLLTGWLRRAGHSPWRVIVYAWNPLVILEVAGSGHLDVLGALLLFLSFLALSTGFTLVAAVAFVAAIEVKFLPIVLAPLFWRRIRRRDALMAAAIGIGLAVPFVSVDRGPPIGSLAVYLEHWRFNGPLFDLVRQVAPGRWLPILPLAAGLMVAMALRARASSPAAWAWPMAASLALMPAIFPWYLVWLTPFLFSLGSAVLLVWTQTVLLTYAAWLTFPGTDTFQAPWWAVAIEYGAVVAVAIRAATGWRRARAGGPSTGDGT